MGSCGGSCPGSGVLAGGMAAVSGMALVVVYLLVAISDLALSPGSLGVGASVFPVSVSFFRSDSTMASLSPADSTSLLDPSPRSSFFVGLSPSLSVIVVSRQRYAENQDLCGYQEEILSLLFSCVGKPRCDGLALRMPN